MIRLLCLISAMNAGGAETFLMKIYRSLDRSRYQLDFCVNTQEEGFYDAEIVSLGGKIYHIPSKSDDFKAFSQQLAHIIKAGGYENVLRITSNGMGFYDLYIAKRAGAKNCIARSSNSSDGGSLRLLLAHLAGRALFQKYVDVEVAPSDLAAVYTFGKKDFEAGKVSILHNGIDFTEYRFSEEKRAKTRLELGVSQDSFVLGHIGRFSKQKNHTFLLDVFAEVLKRRSDSVLLLVGDGEQKDSIRNQAERLEIGDKIVFAGVQRDIPAMLSAMDVFLFPSLYEGMPNAVIEAQATGLPCIVSDSITNDVVITNLVQQLPIRSAEDWAEAVERCWVRYLAEHRLRQKCLIPETYDIKLVASAFISFLK